MTEVNYDYTHLTDDEKLNGIGATKIPKRIRTSGYVSDFAESVAQLAELLIQALMNKGLDPDEALEWARKLQESISQSEFDSWVATLLDGGPSIFMNTLSELQSTYPNGAAGVALVRETDPAKIYVWNGSAWEDFGDYQGVEVKDESITSSKLSDGAVTFEKQDVISVRDDKGINVKEVVDVSDLYTNSWINFETGEWATGLNYDRSIVAPIRKKSKIKVNTHGSHDRFVIYTSNRDSITSETTWETIYIKGTDGVSSGNEEYEFYNDVASYIIIGITATRLSYYPKVELTTTVEDTSNQRLNKIEEGYPDLYNFVKNGDFSDGLKNWDTEYGATATMGSSYAILRASQRRGVLKQTLGPRTQDEKFYITVTVKTNSNQVGLDLNGVVFSDLRAEGTNEYEKISTVFSAPSSGSYWYVGLKDERSSGWDDVLIKNFMVIPLTRIYGEGNEPTVYDMDYIVDEILNGYFEDSVSSYVSMKDAIAIEYNRNTTNASDFVDVGISKTKSIYPVMFGVKMSNEVEGESPRPLGWLYYHPETEELLYADGSPDNMRFLCKWNRDITWNGSRDPSWYRPHITAEGDIIFVYRGDRHGLGTSDPDSRQNPIIYPAGDWNNPFVVDFGDRLKPTSWLQNSGVEQIYKQDCFIFAEYTRPHHLTCNTWKVTKPYSNPDNWRVVQSFTLSGSNQTGMKHLHQVDYDPYSKAVFTSTGDGDTAAKVYRSTDYGENWEVVLEGQRKYARVINFVFTKDKVYWANDDSLHGFYSVDRDVNGMADFTNITTLADLTGHPPTYVNALVDDPYGILILHRYDGTSEGPLIVHFWDIENELMHEIKSIKPLENENTEWGFRVEAANFYQSKGSNETVVGFNSPHNKMDLLNNSANNRINNMVLKVVEKNGDYDLKISAVNHRE